MNAFDACVLVSRIIDDVGMTAPGRGATAQVAGIPVPALGSRPQS